MMIRNIIGCGGCLTILIIFFLFTFLLKFWFLIFIAIIAYIYIKEIRALIEKLRLNFKDGCEYKSNTGKVYKQCAFCDTKNDRNALVCCNCKQPFER